jgi:hypothetical protein
MPPVFDKTIARAIVSSSDCVHFGAQFFSYGSEHLDVDNIGQPLPEQPLPLPPTSLQHQLPQSRQGTGGDVPVLAFRLFHHCINPRCL